MARRGIRQRRYNAINSLPDVDLASLYKSAKLADVMELPINKPAFVIAWHIDNGVDREDVVLRGGEFINLREAEAREFFRVTRENGGIIVADDLSDEDYETERLAATLKSVQQSMVLFGESGLKMVRTLMRQADPPRSFNDLGDWKTDYFPWLINEERHKVLVKHSKKISTDLAKARIVSAEAKALEPAEDGA